MIEYSNEDIIDEFKIKNDRLKKDKDLFFKFKTSGTEGKSKIIFSEVNISKTAFKLFLNHFGIQKGTKLVLTSKITDNHIYGSCIKKVCEENDYILFNDSEELKNNVSFINQGIQYIFTTPSFLINFKDFIKLNKNQIIILTGEKIPQKLYDDLISKELQAYESFGSTEAFLIGTKKINEDYYTFFNENINYDSGFLYSPYVSKYVIFNDEFIINDGKVKLTDDIEVIDRKFRFIQRDSNIVKINEETISLKDISDFLEKQKTISDFCVFKINKNDFEQIILFHTSFLSENDVKKMIYHNFKNFNYIPKFIYKIDKFPLTLIGKKDISELKKWIE